MHLCQAKAVEMLKFQKFRLTGTEPYPNRNGQLGIYAWFLDNIYNEYLMISRSNCTELPTLTALAKEVEGGDDTTTHARLFTSRIGSSGTCATIRTEVGWCMLAICRDLLTRQELSKLFSKR